MQNLTAENQKESQTNGRTAVVLQHNEDYVPGAFTMQEKEIS